MTRVPELMAAGLTFAFGHDCAMDPYYPMGSGDMLEVASMGLHVSQMTGMAADALVLRCRDGQRAPEIFGLDGYGLEPGCNADFVILQAGDPAEAIRLRAARLYVVRRDEVIAESAPQTARLHLPGRPGGTSFTG